jgi:hypothetical protein
MLAVRSTCIPACWHGQRQLVACIDVLDWRGRKLATDVDDKTLAVEGSDRWRILVAGGRKLDFCLRNKVLLLSRDVI